MTTFTEVKALETQENLKYYYATCATDDAKVLVVYNDNANTEYIIGALKEEHKWVGLKIKPDSVMVLYDNFILEITDDYDCVNDTDESRIMVNINGKPGECCSAAIIASLCGLSMEIIADKFISEYVQYYYDANCVSNYLKKIYNRNVATIKSEEIAGPTYIWSFRSVGANIVIIVDESTYNFITFKITEHPINLVRMLKDYKIEENLIKAIIAQYPIIAKHSITDVV